LEKKLRELWQGDEEISFFYVVTVNNPTGSILSNERKSELLRIVAELSARKKRKIPLVFDRAYEDLVHDETVPALQSGFLHDESELVYEIGTLSKILSPALRVGYMIGCEGPFLQALVQKTSDVGFSAPMILQEAAGYMLDHHVKAQVEKVNRGYRQKARAAKEWIDCMLGEFLSECSGGRAGFYYYLTFKDIQTTEESPFFHYLARTTGSTAIDGPDGDKKPRVIYIPGEVCVHPRGDLVEKGKRQLRLSYGFEELEKIQEAIGYMREAALSVS
jgi:2-aminoadipate transaminase